jgi:hypothetical protein
MRRNALAAARPPLLSRQGNAERVTMTGAIATTCTACGKAYRLRPVLRGHLVRCRACGCVFAVEAETTRRMAAFLARAPKPTPRLAPRGKVWPRRGIHAPRPEAPRVLLQLPPVLLFGISSLALVGLSSLATFLAVQTFIAP